MSPMRRSRKSGGIHGRRCGAKSRWSSPWGLVVGGAELELNSFKTASGEILPDEGPVDVALFLTGWSQMPASRACHGCPQASDPSRQGARQRQSGRLAFQWRLDPLWELPTGILISRAMTKGPRQAQTDELIQLLIENNIYNF